MPIATDSSANSRVSADDASRTQAVAAAFRTHSQLVERVLRRAGVKERDLGDARQEVFIVVHRRLAEFEGRASLSTWLYRIALHVASDYRRRAYHRRERLAGDVRVDGDGGVERALDAASDPAAANAERDPLARLEQRELLAHVLRALEGLDCDQREAFVLSELYELPMREVASRLGCPAKTAFSRTYAARRRILAELHKHGALPLFPLFMQPLRALRALRFAPASHAAHAALAPVSALGPFGWFAAAAVACLLAVAFVPRAASTHPRTAAHDAAVASAPALATRPAKPRAKTATATSTVVAGSARRSAVMSASAVVDGAVASPLRAARRPRQSAQVMRLPTAASSAASLAPAAELDDMQVVRSGALDLRPQLQSPLAASLPEPLAVPPRIRVRGPSDPADGVENALVSDPVFAYPIARD